MHIAMEKFGNYLMIKVSRVQLFRFIYRPMLWSYSGLIIQLQEDHKTEVLVLQKLEDAHSAFNLYLEIYAMFMPWTANVDYLCWVGLKLNVSQNYLLRWKTAKTAAVKVAVKLWFLFFLLNRLRRVNKFVFGFSFNFLFFQAKQFSKTNLHDSLEWYLTIKPVQS